MTRCQDKVRSQQSKGGKPLPPLPNPWVEPLGGSECPWQNWVESRRDESSQCHVVEARHKHPAILSKHMHVSALILYHIHHQLGHAEETTSCPVWWGSTGLLMQTLLPKNDISECVVCRCNQEKLKRWRTYLWRECCLMKALLLMLALIILGSLWLKEADMLDRLDMLID